MGREAGLGHVLTRSSEMHGGGEGTALEVGGEPEGLIRRHRRGCEARSLFMLCVLKQMLPLGREDPLEKKMATHSVPLLGKSHGWRSLVGYSPWGCKESDTTE